MCFSSALTGTCSTNGQFECENIVVAGKKKQVRLFCVIWAVEALLIWRKWPESNTQHAEYFNDLDLKKTNH